MPLIAWLAAAHLVGVLAGFAAPPAWVAAGSALVCVAGFRKGVGGRAIVIAIVAVGGAASARAAKAERDRCGREAIVPVRAKLDRDAVAGSFVTAELACGSPVGFMVAVGSAPAGTTVRATGIAVRSAKGVVVQHAVLSVVTPPSLWARARNATGASIDRLFGGDAPLIRALVIADKHELSPELRDRFASAGLAHVLAISGLHVGIIAAIVEGLLAGLRVPRAARAPIAFGVVVGYVVMIGAPAAAVRAGVMLGVRAFTRLIQRPTSPWAILALAATGPVVDPWIALEAGFQLSVVGVAALIVATRVADRLPLAPRPRWRRVLASALVCSTIATIATAPLAAWTFGRVSAVAPLSGVIAVPIVALLQPAVLVALAAPYGVLATFVAGAVHPLVVALETLAAFAASLPWASFTLSPTPAAAILGGIASAAVLIACASRQFGRPLIVAGVCSACLAIPTPNEGSGLTELHVIDVGQGDAIALRTPRGRWVLFDAGPAGFGVDAGRAIVLPYLERRGGPLVAFVLSHPHTDHVGGAAAVIQALHPSAYYDPGYAAPTEFYRHSLEEAVDEHAMWRRVHPGDSLVVDGVVITLLGPDSTWAVGLRDPNNASTIALVRAGNVRFLLVGDAEKSEEDWLLQHDSADLHADVLKVGHHGSNTSSTEPFLDAVHPRLALVSVGAGNKYGHPSPETMRAIAEHGAQVLRTDLDGTIVVRTDGRTVSVEAAGDRWTIGPGSEQ